jgi:hypothetical protein
MSHPLYSFPVVFNQTLRALARYPSRTAFSWPDGSLSYQGATDLIGRMQAVFTKLRRSNPEGRCIALDCFAPLATTRNERHGLTIS